MNGWVEVDVWVRGTHHATTHRITSVPATDGAWTEDDVRRLLSEMLLALDRESNPGSEPPPVTLRGFNWIVSRFDSGVLVHLDVQLGTASAGPIAIDERRLNELIARVVDPRASESVH
jgi:hypothetical protein